MNKLPLLLIVFLSFASMLLAQTNKKVLSPAQTLEASIEDIAVIINYNAPSVRERKVFGENGLEPFGKIWRTGANEATTIAFSDDVLVEGEALPKGRYSLFSIPGESEWTIIFNKVAKQWGAYSYDSNQDVLRVQVKPTTVEEHTEMMAFEVKGNTILLKWDKIVVPFEVGAAVE